MTFVGRRIFSHDFGSKVKFNLEFWSWELVIWEFFFWKNFLCEEKYFDGKKKRKK
jgi:hypothetical protein